MSGKGGDNGSCCCGVGVCGDGDDGEVIGNRDDGGLVGGSGRGMVVMHAPYQKECLIGTLGMLL